MRKLLSLLLVIVMAVCCTSVAFAASSDANQAANTLHAAGLFNGSGTDTNGEPIYALDRASTREEAVAMLVRLLGKESEATSGQWNMPFTDVSPWATPYVGYAYAQGLTSGTSSTTFSGKSTVTASQYLTFVLRALGYTSGTDFQWNNAWELSDQIGLTHGQYHTDSITLLRGDMAIISNNALATYKKGGKEILAETLSLSVPAVLSPGNNEMQLLRADIMSAWYDALIHLQSAYELVRESLNSLNANTVAVTGSVNATAMYYVHEAQKEFAASQSCTQKSIQLCGSYPDTKDAKTALTNYANTMYPKILSYQFDNSLNNYQAYTELVIQCNDNSGVYRNKIVEIMRHWTAQ